MMVNNYWNEQQTQQIIRHCNTARVTFIISVKTMNRRYQNNDIYYVRMLLLIHSAISTLVKCVLNDLVITSLIL